MPDHRWPSGAFNNLNTLSITNFEVVQSTGANEGPRSSGAPVVSAGPDFLTPPGTAVTLAGSVLYTNTSAVSNRWTLYSGPGQVTFSDAQKTNTTATFALPGTYTLILKAENGIHTPGYDAVVVTVTDSIQLRIRRTGTNLALEWQGGRPPYTIERATTLPATQWQSILTTNGTNLVIGPGSGPSFFRVKGQ